MSYPSDANAATVSPADRLAFALFVAAALHGLLILGVGFDYLARPNTPPTFEVTLATHRSVEAPEEADYQAQFNQEASGTRDEARELRTDREALFEDTLINEVTPLPESRQRRQREARESEQLTADEARRQVAEQNSQQEAKSAREQDGAEQDLPALTAEISSLRAKLDRQRQEYAKRPRVRRLTSVSAVASAEAAYLNRWRQTVEEVGNENFPQRAVDEEVFGELRLAAVVKPDGSIARVEILESSGHDFLDRAAREIVHRSAPFRPFPPEIAGEWDQLEIIRTWRFDVSGLTTSQ